MKRGYFFPLLFILDLIILLFQIRNISISYSEAQILYGAPSLLQSILWVSLKWFGQNDYALRLPMLLLHAGSVVLLYEISKTYLKRVNDRLWMILFFLLLPGVTSAALVVDYAGFLVFGLLLFYYVYLKYDRYALAVAIALSLVHPSFGYLFVGVIIYGMNRKNWVWISGGAASLSITLFVFGINITGTPKGHFLDLLGLYAAIFSPVVFMYLFYVLYRRIISKEWDMIGIIALSAFVFSFLLSFRQKVEIHHFAPYLFLMFPIAAQTFLHTYRIRLNEFRVRYKILLYSALFLLLVNSLVVFFNPYFYRWVDKPSRHFAYSMHVAKELGTYLKQQHISCINCKDEKMQLRLRFYGISHCDAVRLQEDYSTGGKKVTISYINKPVFTGYVTKLNTKNVFEP